MTSLGCLWYMLVYECGGKVKRSYVDRREIRLNGLGKNTYILLYYRLEDIEKMMSVFILEFIYCCI